MINLPRPAEPDVSVIILGWTNAAGLERCLVSLAAADHSEVEFETIVVLNGALPEVRTVVEEGTSGARAIYSPVNLGFAGGRNRGRSAARARYLLFLNDDVEVDPGWLPPLVETAEREDAGAVGGRIVGTDGALLEAGSLIWRDGSTLGVGRDLAAEGPEYRYLRRVDYCSAYSLLVPAHVFDEVGGFDEEYYPAYYEDVDLCLAIAELGKSVYYQPVSRVRHGGSSAKDESFRHFLMARGRERLRSKWNHVLESQPEQDPASPIACARAIEWARKASRRLLIVDDRVPRPGVGAGFGRMYDAVRELVSDGVAISLAATQEGDSPELDALGAYGVRVIPGPLEDHLADPATWYDVVLVSRPFNFASVAPLVRRHQPHAMLVYDTEALWHRRIERQIPFTTTRDEHASLVRAYAETKTAEIDAVTSSDHVVCISTEERAVVDDIAGHAPCSVVEPFRWRVRSNGPGWSSRKNMVFSAGWTAGIDSPNADGLRWFVAEILPIVTRRLPWVRLWVTGASPPEPLRQLEGPSVTFLGQVADLGHLYDQARVAVIPLRFGAGVKLKTVDALEHGVPIVATSIGAEGLPRDVSQAFAVEDEPAAFADAVCNLLESPRAWELARRSLCELGSTETTSTLTWVDFMATVWSAHASSRFTTEPSPI